MGLARVTTGEALLFCEANFRCSIELNLGLRRGGSETLASRTRGTGEPTLTTVKTALRQPLGQQEPKALPPRVQVEGWTILCGD
jgi:hypothetical protein